ncbi:MAG: hypothetical protein EP318_21580 [Rhodobacteraceae bacterium]|nr:MAG: hypothetical protein EP318_21580 [Paracoccaceae bacterium]
MMLAQETIPPDEALAIERLLRANLKTVWMAGKTAKRGQHGKHHGLAEGTFRIRDDLPASLAHGVFQPGQSYRCLVRFSNGEQLDDREEDVRGMAIKLLDVGGTKLLPGRGDRPEQDFLLIDSPTYFTATMADYLAFNRHFTPLQDLRRNGRTPGRLLRAAWGLAMLGVCHRDTLKAAQRMAGRRVGSPLALRYHSTTPYLLGPGQAVKYKAIGQTPDPGPTQEVDGLCGALWTALGQGPASFDFGVVVQDDPAAQPIEDPTVDWEENGARFTPVATLTLPQQENAADKDALAETLRFNPWMSLPDHRPLGYINRARREVYRAMADLRQRKTRPG